MFHIEQVELKALSYILLSLSTYKSCVISLWSESIGKMTVILIIEAQV